VRAGRQRLAFTLPVVGKEWADEPEASTVSADGRWLAGARRPDGTISVWDLATGAEVAKRSGYGTPVECLAFRPDGKALASGHDDGTALVWDLSGLAPIKPAATNREAAWTDLAADAERAYRAVLALAADPGCAAFLRGRVKPTAAAPADEVARLVGELDSADFATRERATAALAKLGDGAAAGLRAALAGDLSAEQRRRVESVLGKWGPAVSDPERLRALRCVEALERSGTAEARALLAGLAGGAAGARLTREAADALSRLGPAPRKPN